MDAACERRDDQSSGMLHALAARSINLLKVIDETLVTLGMETDLLDAHTRQAEKALEALRAHCRTDLIDPDRRIGGAFKLAITSSEQLHAKACMQRHAARLDKALTPDDGVVEAYDTYIESIAGVHEALQDLLEYVETHDALLAPRGETLYASVDDMMGDILAGR